MANGPLGAVSSTARVGRRVPALSDLPHRTCDRTRSSGHPAIHQGARGVRKAGARSHRDRGDPSHVALRRPSGRRGADRPCGRRTGGLRRLFPDIFDIPRAARRLSRGPVCLAGVAGPGHRPPAAGHVARVAVDRDYGRMEWSVLDWNDTAMDLYRSIGARAMDEWTVFRLTGERARKAWVDGLTLTAHSPPTRPRPSVRAPSHCPIASRPCRPRR